MELGFFVWLLGILGAIILGAFISAVWYLAYHFYMKYQDKKLGVPKSKKDVSEWIKANKEELKDAGNIKITDRKEAEEDDKRRFAKYREFERLRHLVKTESSSGEHSSNGESVSVPGKDDRSSVKDRTSDSGTVDLE